MYSPVLTRGHPPPGPRGRRLASTSSFLLSSRPINQSGRARPFADKERATTSSSVHRDCPSARPVSRRRRSYPWYRANAANAAPLHRTSSSPEPPPSSRLREARERSTTARKRTTHGESVTYRERKATPHRAYDSRFYALENSRVSIEFSHSLSLSLSLSLSRSLSRSLFLSLADAHTSGIR